MSPSSRMLRLLSLLQTHRFWAGEELADRLEVSPRTLRRDIDRLRELGYPVDATRGTAGGYRLQAGSALPPLLLDDEEAVAMAVGLRSAAGGSGVEGMEETSVRALAKLEQVLPNHLRRQVEALGAYTEPMTWARGPVVDPECLTVIAQACRDDERLQFEYTAREGEETSRAVEPHKLVCVGRRWYLVAYDVHRADWRTFRVDRLREPRVSGARFVPRTLPAPDAATYVQESIRSRPQRYTATVTVLAPADEVGWAPRAFGGTVEPDGETRCTVRLSGDSLDWLAAGIALLDHDVAVDGPPELTQRLGRLATRLAA